MRSPPGRQRRPRSPSPGDRSGLAATKRVRLTRPVPATALVTPPSAPAAALLPGLVAPASQSLPLTPLAVAPARARGAYERFDELGWLRGLLGRLHHHAAASPLPRLPVASAPGHPGRPEMPVPGTCVSPRASSTSAWGDGHEAVPPVNALPAHVARNSQPSQVPVPSPDADPGGHQRAAWLSPAPAATPLPSPRARPHPTDTPDHMSGADPSAPYRLGQTAVLRPHQPGPVQAPNERRAPPRRQSAAVQAVCPITFETQSPSLEQCTDRRHPETQVKMNKLRDSARPCEPPRRTVEHDHNHKHKHKYEREPHIAAPAVTVENEQARPNAAERMAESGRTAAKARCLATAERESQDRSRQAGDERLGHAACRAQDATTLAEQGRCMAAGRSVERCRLPHEQHSLPASAAKQDHVLEQHRVIEAERMAEAERQAAAEAREAEQLRQADEAHSAEEARQVEEARQAVEARLARLANEAHMAVEARLADARRKAEQHRLIEATCPPHDPAVADREPATEKQVRLDDTEQATNESGQSENTCMAQADRVAEQLRLLGQLRRAVDRRLAAEHERSTEAKRLAKAKREASEQHRFKVERQALAKRHAEREHSAEQARLAEHLNESQRQAKETIQAEGAQPAEKARPADEARLAKETGMIEEGTLPELPRLSKQAQLPEQTDMVVPQSRLIEKVCPPEANFLSKDTCRAEETQEGPPDLEEDCLNEKKLVDQQQHLTADQSHFASAELFTEEARLASKMWLAEQVRLPNTKHSGDQEYSLETERMPDVTQPDELPCIGLEARSVEAGCSASQKYLAEQVQSSEQRRLPGDGENLTAQERLNQHDGLIDSAPITFSWSDLCIDTSLDGQSGETCPTVHLEEDFASDARRDDNDIAKVGRRVQGLQLDARTGLGTSSDHDKVSSPAPSSSYAPSEAPVQRKTPKQAAGHGGSRPVTRSQYVHAMVFARPVSLTNFRALQDVHIMSYSCQLGTGREHFCCQSAHLMPRHLNMRAHRTAAPLQETNERAKSTWLTFSCLR